MLRLTDLPAPSIPAQTKPFNMLVTIGGTGVLTVGQVLGMAAFSKAKACHHSRYGAWRKERQRDEPRSHCADAGVLNATAWRRAKPIWCSAATC